MFPECNYVSFSCFEINFLNVEFHRLHNLSTLTNSHGKIAKTMILITKRNFVILFSEYHFPIFKNISKPQDNITPEFYLILVLSCTLIMFK